jgi:hypothetical protein
MAHARWLVAALLAVSRGVTLAGPIVVTADATFTDAVRVVVEATNAGTEALRLVSPEVRYRLAERTGAPVDLAPGSRHSWRVDFPLPGGPGGEPLIVVARWEDATGTRHSLPYARALDTPGLLPTEAQLIVEPEPAAGRERALVRISNATADPLRGRLVALLPDECFTTPVAQPVDVAPRQSIRVPIDVQSSGPVGTTYPLYALFQFEQGGIPRAIVAPTLLGVGVTPNRGSVRPLTVGTGALLLALGVLVAANWQAARRRRTTAVDGTPGRT